jgi:hypothetical protein
METHKVVSRRSTHISWTIGSQMAVNLSALRTGRPLPPSKFLVLISVRGRADSRAIVWREGLGQLKETTSFGLESVTFWLEPLMPQPTELPRAP